MKTVHNFIVRQTGWRRLALAAGLGVFAALALPPLYLVFMLLPAFVGLMWLLRAAASGRAALAVGWMFGVGFFAVGLYWVSLSFFVDPWRHGWMAPFAVIGLAGALAGFPAIVAWGVRATASRPWVGPLVLAAGWGLSEWVRSWLLTGFPWNLLASVWTVNDAMIQSTAWIGSYGLSAVTVFVASLPAAIYTGRDRAPRQGLTATATAVVVLAVLWAGGYARLTTTEPGIVDGVRVRIVQPNIPQQDKWRPAMRDVIFKRLLDLSAAAPTALRPAPNGKAQPARIPDVIVWPETATPFFVAEAPWAKQAIAARLRPGGVLITGTPRRLGPGDPAHRVWNSVVAIDAKAQVIATYDKFHLVPFGEYLPLRPIMERIGLSKLTAGVGDFSFGPGPRTLSLPGLPPLGPLICYEIIFPRHVVDPAHRPRWLLNLTNDGWFGISSGPHQHLASARLRAVEEGLPVYRAANTGISAVIDALGRQRTSLALQTAGILDSVLYSPLSRPTFYSKWGGWLPALLALILVTARYGRQIKRRNNL